MPLLGSIMDTTGGDLGIEEFRNSKAPCLLDYHSLFCFGRQFGFIASEIFSEALDLFSGFSSECVYFIELVIVDVLTI